MGMRYGYIHLVNKAKKWRSHCSVLAYRNKRQAMPSVQKRGAKEGSDGSLGEKREPGQSSDLEVENVADDKGMQTEI
ncbi:hypothetical protein SLEP1_g40788 [Rubroshorea leprosula]|uniref:Uncharacterized protein n=1 Tax=Rubroshorea leprosula TaxID=152421 RepID=A0AAV5L4M9_9ROSI|nr:hypothetical protein SLEP1_g40788 [Rubroshorea leprosula]